MCLHDSDCGGDNRCCFNGCQNDCVPASMKNIEMIDELRNYFLHMGVLITLPLGSLATNELATK